jgi:hypothetical protein
MVSDAVLSDEARETRAVEPPPYRPYLPGFAAGYWYAQQQAAEMLRSWIAAQDQHAPAGKRDAAMMQAGRVVCDLAAGAILAMRPKPPTAPAAGELRNYPIGHPVASIGPNRPISEGERYNITCDGANNGEDA